MFYFSTLISLCFVIICYNRFPCYIPDVPGHVVRVPEHTEPDPGAQPHRAAAVVAPAGPAGVSAAALPQRRLHDVPQPTLAALRAAPLRGLPRLLPLRLAARAPRSPAARLPGALWRQALRLRAVRPELQVPFCLCQTSRTKPSR